MRINHLVKGRRPLTAELALRLGRYFGQSPRYWINLCRAGMIWMWLKIRYPSAWHVKCDPSRQQFDRQVSRSEFRRWCAYTVPLGIRVSYFRHDDA